MMAQQLIVYFSFARKIALELSSTIISRGTRRPLNGIIGNVMKRNRLIFLILWILSLVGISFFGGPVSYGFFTVFTLIPVICLFYLVLVYFFFHIL